MHSSQIIKLLICCRARRGPTEATRTKEKTLRESTIFHATEPSGGIFVSHTAFETLMVKSGQNAVSPVRSNKSNGNEAAAFIYVAPV
jgi:hypothetical protein